MASNLRAVPSQQDGWIWDGSRWVCDPDPCPPCNPCPPGMVPVPCPPSGFPTPCPPWFPPPAGQAPWYPGANGGVSFSATPPPNPVRGHFWWDGTMLHLFDGASWVDIGPSSPGMPGGGGAFVGTSPPANPASGALWWNGADLQVWDGTRWNATSGELQFAITNTTAKTIPGAASAWGIVPLGDSPQVDLQSAWNPVTHQFQPKFPGNYIFLVRGLCDAVALVKNDAGNFTGGLSSDIVVAISSQPPPATVWVAAEGIAVMNGTTDYVRLWARSSTSSFPATGANPCFSAAAL